MDNNDVNKIPTDLIDENGQLNMNNTSINETIKDAPPTIPPPLDKSVPQEAYFIKSLASWASFKAVIDIIIGVVSALNVLGIIALGIILAFTKSASDLFLDSFGDAKVNEDLNILSNLILVASIALIVFGIMSGFIAYFKLMAGIKLLKAVDKIKEYLRYNLFDKIYAFMYDLSKHFKFTGIYIILNIALYAIGIIGYIIFIVVLVTSYGDIFNSLINF